ncbi:Peptidoglycan-binding (PGRP) domain of peptidoglycan hydrolases-containing protein [Jiangella alkaliphila]|uniref:Peptidoglycan-binding (PGRP) domain of peptidoglycan hydrolases-containing protein n=2 Tax=Jiangella alkaliphila TaxID=419479 RepID=A0A1H2IDH0_9ACTN|nr:Peptidoglycan-binding (PGRP) domain of peptidoglycan hydrolases-containing protein [Jiangella alkaliphila]
MGALIAVLAVAVVSAVLIGLNQFGGDEPASASPQTSGQTATQPAEETPSDTPTPTATPTPTPTATPTPTPTTPPALMAAGATGDQVRELQARLKQLQWYAPDINGEFDDVTIAAVTGFQEKRELPVTGEVDQVTWDTLVGMTETPTEDELNNVLTPGPTILGPGDTGDQVRELQARLKQIDWYSGDVTDTYGDTTTAAVKGFQERREFPTTGEVDQRTWDKIVEMTSTPTDDELHNREPENNGGDTAGLDERCLTGRVLCIDKSNNSLRWVVDGEVRMSFDVRFGTDETPTREGEFQVNSKSRDHVSSLYDTPMPFAMFFSRGQAVHYSPDFAANGYNGGSHGCVNVRDRDAIESLFDQVNIGDKVIVYWS